VANSGNHTVSVLDSNGDLQTVIAQQTGKFVSPMDITIDVSGRIYVLNNNRTISVLKPDLTLDESIIGFMGDGGLIDLDAETTTDSKTAKIAVDNEGRIIIIHNGAGVNDRKVYLVQIKQPFSEPEASAEPSVVPVAVPSAQKTSSIIAGLRSLLAKLRSRWETLRKLVDVETEIAGIEQGRVKDKGERVKDKGERIKVKVGSQGPERAKVVQLAGIEDPDLEKIAVDKNGNMFVIDKKTNKVSIHRPDGTLNTDMGVDGFLTYVISTDANGFQLLSSGSVPVDIAISDDGHIIMACKDKGGDSVSPIDNAPRIFDSEGKFVKAIPMSRTNVSAVAVDGDVLYLFYSNGQASQMIVIKDYLGDSPFIYTPQILPDIPEIEKGGAVVRNGKIYIFGHRDGYKIFRFDVPAVG